MFSVTTSLLTLTTLCSIIFSGIAKTTLLPGRDVCGKQEEQRIYGGEEAVLGEFPWLALLGIKIGDEKSQFFCGGALISSRYILTAAHCMDGLETIDTNVKIVIRLGEHNKTSEEDCEGNDPGLQYCADPPLDLVVTETIVHENYTAEDKNHRDDIALLRLEEEVSFNDFIHPICLPFGSELVSNTFENSTVVVAGWGATSKNQFESDVKLKVELPVKPLDNCATYYKLFAKEVLKTQICAGGKRGKDSCQGDSGGPLMYRHQTDDEENWVAVGVVSYGMGCGHLVPGIYTRVTEYLDWITNNMNP